MLKELYWFKEEPAAFAENLKLLIKEKGLTVQKLVDLIDCDYISYETVKKWKTGERLPDLDYIQKMAKALNVTMEELYLPNSVLKIKENEYTNLYSNAAADENKFEIFRKFYLELSKKDNCTDVFTVEELKRQKDFKEEINYLLQKRLFSFLTLDEEEKLRFYFKHVLCFEWEDEYEYHTQRYDYDDFWEEIEGDYIVNAISNISRKYTITREEMKKEYFDFKKKITFAPYKYCDKIIPQINTINTTIELIEDEEVLRAYFDTFDKLTLNCIYTSKKITKMAKKILSDMGAKKINCKFEYDERACDIYYCVKEMSYTEYLNAIGGSE